MLKLCTIRAEPKNKNHMNTNEIPQGEIDQLVADIDLIQSTDVLPSGKREELVEDLRSAVNCLASPVFPARLSMLQKIKQRIKEVLSDTRKEPLVLEGQAA